MNREQLLAWLLDADPHSSQVFAREQLLAWRPVFADPHSSQVFAREQLLAWLLDADPHSSQVFATCGSAPAMNLWISPA